MKFLLKYLNLKTMDTISKIDFSPTFDQLFGNWAFSSTSNISQIQISRSVLESAYHEIWIFEFDEELTDILKL